MKRFICQFGVNDLIFATDLLSHLCFDLITGGKRRDKLDFIKQNSKKRRRSEEDQADYHESSP